MAKKIVIKPIREWGEKEGTKVLTSIRLYIGKMHVATVRPDRIFKDEYYTHCFFDCINVENKRLPLEDIKSQIELSLKEFISGVVKEFIAL